MDSLAIPLYIGKGIKDLDWYHVTEQTLIELFGSSAKTAAKLLAATSINTSLKGNITLFRRALWEIENDKPVGRYLPNIQLQINRVRNGEELSGRKIRSFAAAMSGDINAVVVDVWLLRAFGEDRKYLRTESNRMRSGGATDRQYSDIEQWCRDYAYANDLEPRQVSAMIWSGVRTHFGGKQDTRYCAILKSKFVNLFGVI